MSCKSLFTVPAIVAAIAIFAPACNTYAGPGYMGPNAYRAGFYGGYGRGFVARPVGVYRPWRGGRVWVR